jgi:hypothetical protein
MTMEVSSNSRDGLPSSSTTCTTPPTISLQLSVEQWELLRRLRNSHLTKSQIIRAYDELDRLDRELGNLFNSAPTSTCASSLSSSTHVHSIDSLSPTAIISPPLSGSQSHTNHANKRSHSQSSNGLTSNRSSTSYHSTSSSSNSSTRTARNTQHENNATVANQHEAIKQIDLEDDTRELQELLG